MKYFHILICDYSLSPLISPSALGRLSLPLLLVAALPDCVAGMIWHILAIGKIYGYRIIYKFFMSNSNANLTCAAIDGIIEGCPFVAQLFSPIRPHSMEGNL